MIVHIAYAQSRCPNAVICLATIRMYLDQGWQVSQVLGPEGGPFVVLFRKDEEAV